MGIVRLPDIFDVRTAVIPHGETVDWGLSQNGIPGQWEKTQGEDITFGVLDTGIDADHHDIAPNLVIAKDFTGSEVGPHDKHGHGTHCAGTVAAARNEGGVVGVAPKAKIASYKVLGDYGSGSDRAVYEGIVAAVDDGCDVLSMSLGSPQESRLIRRGILYAVERNRLVIAAAGNAGGSRLRHTVGYPGGWPETACVAAVDKDGRIASFSSWGEAVDVAAPGVNILSCKAGGGYVLMSGTSMATPFVTGVVCLMLSLHKKLGDGAATPINGVESLRSHLRQTARDAGPVGHDPQYGWGLINPEGLLAAKPDDDVPQTNEWTTPATFNGQSGTIYHEFIPEAA